MTSPSTVARRLNHFCGSDSHASLQHGHPRIIAPLDLGDSGGQHQQQAAGHLQAVGQPGYCQGPAERHVHGGELLRVHGLLEVLHGLAAVLDVDQESS